MEPDTFQAFQEIAYAKAGIFLRQGKAALVQARLAKRLRELGLASEREYLARLRGDGGSEEVVLFLDAISTNFTKFFREPDHFEALEEHVRHLRSAGQRRFRFWSSACSSGEEPYTAAMVLDPLLEGCDWKILATDISTRVLARAADGVYNDEEIEPVSAALRSRYLLESPATGDGQPRWTVKPRLRERIVFRRLNLAARPYPMSGPLDAVFCRNVMIYFDRPMREGLVHEFERLLRPGSPLYVGHSETLNGIPTRLRTERPSVYRLPEDGR
jgi:chemotaxis protein methyltransferase CheR